MLTPDQIELLDHGIRELVIWLNAEGFETSDSGDGATKGDAGWPVPNVAIKSRPAEMLADAHILMMKLAGRGVVVKPCNLDDEPFIQATYDPAEESVIIVLGNVNDAVFRGDRKKWNVT